jgi:Beta-lactamase
MKTARISVGRQAGRSNSPKARKIRRPSGARARASGRGRDWRQAVVVFFLSALAQILGFEAALADESHACGGAGCVSEAKLAQALCAPLAGEVTGFACRVGEQPATFGGLARTDRDLPRRAFGSDTILNVASLTKIVAAIATLKLLAENHLDEDARIAPFLYSDWERGPNVERLTFRQLLTHSSGFLQAGACDGADSYAALKRMVAHGVAEADIGKPAYGNCNFALLRELAPALLHRRLTLLPDGPLRAAKSADLFLDALNDKVLAPAGVARRTCRPAPLALAYPTGDVHGETFGDWTLTCGAAGLQLSVDDLHAVLRALASGETLLAAETRRKMFAECLGWDCAVGADCGAAIVCKHGALTSGSGATLWAYAGIVNCDAPVVVLVNSQLPPQYQNGGNVFALVRDAFAKAGVGNKAAPCP